MLPEHRCSVVLLGPIHDFHFVRLFFEFPNLHSPGNEVALSSDIVRRQSFSRREATITQNKQNFSVMRGSAKKIVHGFVPNRDLGTWSVIAGSPAVRFALNKNRRRIRPKIEFMELGFVVDSNLNPEVF